MNIEISAIWQNQKREKRNADAGYFPKSIAYFPVDLHISFENIFRIYFLDKVEREWGREDVATRFIHIAEQLAWLASERGRKIVGECTYPKADDAQRG